MSEETRIPSRMLSFEERYDRDPMLKAVVDMLQGAIERLELTPTEAREAAIFACIKVESRRFRHHRLIRVEVAEEARRNVDAMQRFLDSLVPAEPWERE